MIWNCNHKVVLGSADTRNKNMFEQGILECISLKPGKVFSDYMGELIFFFFNLMWEDFNLMAKGKAKVISTLHYKHWPEPSVKPKLAFCPHFLYSSLDERVGSWLSLGNVKTENSDFLVNTQYIYKTSTDKCFSLYLSCCRKTVRLQNFL